MADYTKKVPVWFQKDFDQTIHLTNVWSTIALYLEDGDKTLNYNDATAAADNSTTSGDNVQYIDMRLNEIKIWKTPPKFAYVCRVRSDIKKRPAGRCYCLLYTSPSPRDRQKSRMPSSA